MISMAVLTPFFDVVAGVAILAGRSSLLDKGVFKTANTNFTVRHLLALGFIGYGGWNLWKIERAQDKLKKTLDAESFGAEKTVCDSCETDDYTLSVCDDCGADYCRKCAGGTSWPPHPFIEDCCIEDFKDASGAESFSADGDICDYCLSEECQCVPCKSCNEERIDGEMCSYCELCTIEDCCQCYDCPKCGVQVAFDEEVCDVGAGGCGHRLHHGAESFSADGDICDYCLSEECQCVPCKSCNEERIDGEMCSYCELCTIEDCCQCYDCPKCGVQVAFDEEVCDVGAGGCGHRLHHGAESFSADERKYQAVDVPLGMVCVLCENDKPATNRIVENGMPFFLCERHWFNYTMGAPNIDADLSAESFGAELQGQSYMMINEDDGGTTVIDVDVDDDGGLWVVVSDGEGTEYGALNFDKNRLPIGISLSNDTKDWTRIYRISDLGKDYGHEIVRLHAESFGAE